MTRKTAVAILISTLAALAGLAAQDLGERGVAGVVTDAADRPLDGAVVQIKDMKTLQVRSFITQDGGKYHFSGLNTNVDYELKAEHNGVWSDTKTLSVFSSKKDTTINLKLKKA